jgi:hypothetical protein
MAFKTDNITKIPDINGLSEVDVSAILDGYFRNLAQSTEETLPGGDILTYFKLVQNACWSRQESEDIPDNKKLLILSEEPPEEKNIDTEAITFFVNSRGPGQYSQGAPGRGSVSERTFHVRSVQQHPEHPSEKLVTMGRSFDNHVVFNIYARTDYQALKRVIWFENVMASFRWYFKIHNILSIEESVGYVGKVEIGNLSLTKYLVSFFVKTEDTYQFGSQELKRIVVNSNISKEG